MDHNIAAWMIAGGPRWETRQSHLEREQLHAFVEAQRTVDDGPSLLVRLRAIVRPVAPVEPACCPA